MAMNQMLGIAGALVLYTVALSLVGEGHSTADRELLHKYMANRAALIAGTVIFVMGILYQLFISNSVDYWLLIGLIVINLTKIISLVFLNYRR